MTKSQNVLFLCSGGGGNLRFIYSLIQSGRLPGLNSVSVIADRKCPAASWSFANGLQTDVVSFSHYNQAELVHSCQSHPSSIIVTNVHKVIGSELIKAYKNKIINLHYSLLPSFGGAIGMQSLSNAIAYGSKVVGATAHHVTEELDGGPPIAQLAFGSSLGEPNAKYMTDLMFRAGCITLYIALSVVKDKCLEHNSANTLSVKDSICLASPYCQLPEELTEEAFWEGLKL